jgi:S-adenosylmethionine:tRNA ribosyltransferase-isomerase
MINVDNISVSDYSYELPGGRIARFPLDNRDQSKLLFYSKGQIEEFQFRSIPELLPENNLLIRNNTRVIQARMTFYKTKGARIEVFCLEPSEPASYETNFASRGYSEWKCLIGNARKWKNEPLIMGINSGNIKTCLRASKIAANNDHFLVRFEWDNSGLTFADILEVAGSTPIPPYLNRNAEEMDRNWYQTVYARFNGSVAAPTAGLHFTDDVFQKLKHKNIKIDEVTLHVGAGTFRPVQKEKITEHEMHVESVVVSKNTIDNLLDSGGQGITAVGTTSLRTLESLYWLGVNLHTGNSPNTRDLIIGQWEPYQNKHNIPLAESLSAISAYLDNRRTEQIRFATRLIIVPGYKFRVADRLITNFHMPGSTLLLLVAAFIGEDWRKVYRYALDNDFRFLSYGDSSLLEIEKR